MIRPRRSWQHLPARVRLTLWYVALLAGTLIVLGGLGQWLSRAGLYAGLDDVLRSKAAAVVTEVDLEKGKLEFPDDGPRNTLPSVAVGLDVVRVWDQNRRQIFQQIPTADFPPLAPEALDAALAGTERYETVPGGEETFRLYLQPIVRKGKVVGALQVGRSRSEIEALLDRMRNLSLVGLAVAIGLAWLGGSFLAGRALRPVDRITTAAEQLSASDLSLRLPPPTAKDELGRLTLAFNGMIARLERSFEQQRRFTADASHELRTPLTTIRSLAEVALASPRDEAYDRRVYTSICDESERLGGLLESLLVLARADQGQPFVLRRVDVDDVVLDAAERVAARARERSIDLGVELSDGAGVDGDPSLLTQLLGNLLENALRHTPAGGNVTVVATATAADVILAVVDTGEGIAPEHLPRLFDRFYRADKARSRGTGGFGLGLAISRWIAQAHHGDIVVSSEVGVGSTFEVRLPLAAPTPVPPAAIDDGRDAASALEVASVR